MKELVLDAGAALILTGFALLPPLTVLAALVWGLPVGG